MRRSVVALGLLLAAGCADLNKPVGPSPSVVSTTDVVLAVGDEVRVDALLRLAFLGVPQDSRCPLSVQCIWQGDGAAAIAYGLGMGPSHPDTLHTTLSPSATEFAGSYRITLLELMPYPARPEPIPLDAYAVRLRVERLAYPPD